MLLTLLATSTFPPVLSSVATSSPCLSLPFATFTFSPIPTRSFISPAIMLSKVLVSSLPLKPNMTESAEAGPITCGKPILRSIVPALCTVHSHKAQKHLARALKRNSRNISSTTNIPPKFHALVSEFVKHIQARRKKQQENKSKTVFKDRMIAA
ncbi:uncharacterized protein LOC124847151 isoform X2 [Vigna umbellata]|uniref:uncharacterized protein LOC124847151 isoform X2 n=1 Tax=Vigna umbellata TaxID=87088 RepID=UPI001F5F6657|nr:uncharacterized protein LOC124847151 isoform X2 [Vigna umbellata]